MAGQIRKEDIIQQQEIQDALASVAKSVYPFINALKEAITEARELNKLFGDAKGLKTLINLSRENEKNTKKQIEAQKQLNGIFKEYIQNLTKQSDGVKQLKQYYSELEKESQRVAAAEKKKNDEMQRSKTALEAQRSRAYTQELKRQEAATRLLIKAKNTAAGSAERLRAVNAMYANRMKELNVLIPEQRAQYERLSQSMRRNNARINEMKSGATGIRGAFNSLIKSVGIYAAAMFALTRVIQFFTRDLLNMVKRLDSLDFSMKTVIETQEEYAQTQVFLADTAISYGQDILTLTERYIKFRAATQQANMSVFDTQRIFDSAAKAAAVLGLKTDEVNGVFLALEQMISKGKVTTEELRRQLGERLPGAFGIMADAIGVSIRELDRMLKAGEVLSAEALPKFADALEKAYGIEAVETVDTLAAALGRLKTSWVQFVDSLEASDVYKFIINELAQTLMQLDLVLNYFSLVYTRTSKLSQEQVSRSFDFLLKLNSRKAREFQDVIKTYSNQSLEEIKNNSHRIIEEINSVYGTSFEQAGLLYDAFVRKVEQKIADRKGGFAEAFDLETYKKELNRVKEDTESLVNVENSELADAIVKSNKYLTDRSTTYKDVLRQQDKELEIQRKLAEINTSNYEDLKTRRDLTTQENKEYEYWTNRAIALTEAQIEVNNRLAESEGKADGGKDDSLKILQQRHRLELEQTKKHQQDLILQNNFSEDELLRVNFENNRELLLQERKQYEQQLELVKDNALEQQKIMADIAKIDAELSKSISDFSIDEAERRQKEEERLEKERIQQLENSASELLAQAEENTHKEYLVIINAANKEIQTSKGRANEIKRIDDQLTLDLIRNEIKNLDFAIEKMDEETEAYRQAMERRRRLREMEGEQENRQEEENQKIRSDLRKQIFEKSGELLMEGFNIANNIYDAQLQKLKEHYDLEVAMAGDSVERRIMAERKYEKEKAKIMRRQAIAEKAQAALGIALNTAQAIMSIWAQVPMADFGISAGILTAIVSALGAAQLAAVLATPIPQFAEGTKHAPDRFVAGEDGQELILKPTGEAVLTPDKPTLFSDKSFIGSTILPHDETQKWLANYAVSQSYDLIDMSFANKYLKKIADNTKGDNREMFTLNGKTYMKRGYVTSLIT